METLELQAEKREKNIKPKQLRAAGKLPAVFYGRKAASTPIAVSKNDFLKLWKTAGESSVVTLKYPEGDQSVLIHNVAKDPVSEEPIHIDFYVVEADRPVEVSVELVFEGESPAVKEIGGTLVKVLHNLEIRGLPKNLPHEIVVDISSLIALDSQILAKDVALPEGIELITNSEEVVAAISEARAEEEEASTEEFDASKIEVEGEKKEGEGNEETAEEK